MEIFTGDFKKHMAKRTVEIVMEVGVPRWMLLPAIILFMGQVCVYQVGQWIIPFLLVKWGAYLTTAFPGVDYWVLTPWAFAMIGWACFNLICFLTMAFLIIVFIFAVARAIIEPEMARLGAPTPLYGEQWIQIPRSLFVRMIKDDILPKERFGAYLERLYNEHPPEKKEVAPDATAK